ncbi:MAG: cell division protein FtsL [Gammaproteobacteria bacterium]
MRLVLLPVLFLLVIVSAIKVVTVQHNARRSFIELQQLQSERDELGEEWGKLQLEQSTWASNDRIESIARQELDMHEPKGASQIFLAP